MTPPTGAHPTSFVIETLQDHYALCSQSGIVTSRSVLDSSAKVALIIALVNNSLFVLVLYN